ncbi:MAG: iron ABC transporter, partial [Pseudomonadales bacterium]|nr:iron ABC transporter [Pseudomonadales bacterium]
MLKMLAGQLSGDGLVLWGGKDIKDFSVQGLAQQIAVVSQINDIVFSLTVEHVVRMGLLPNKTLFS